MRRFSTSATPTDDPDHLEHGYALLTANPGDFQDLRADWQRQGRIHSGIFLIYYDNDSTKDMKPRALVRALANLLDSGLPLANEVHALNHWR